MVNGTIKNLRNGRTKGEKLWLWRQANDLSQAEAAAKLGLTPKQVWKMEADLKDYEIEPTNVTADLGLLCRLARRRHGVGLYQTARLLGISHMTLLQREQQGHPALAAAWKGLGYRF